MKRAAVGMAAKRMINGAIVQIIFNFLFASPFFMVV